MHNKELEILNMIIRQIPVGYIPSHTIENLPDMVTYLVERSSLLGKIEDEASEILNCDTGVDEKRAIRLLMEITGV